MKAPNDDTLNVYSSAGPFAPGSLKVTVACRRVLSDMIRVISDPLKVVRGYATYTSASIVAGNYTPTPDGVSLDTYLNDVLEFGSNPGVYYHAFMVERVAPRSGLPYLRVWFIDNAY